MDTYYTAVEHPELVTFSKRKYITIDGEGAPGSESFYDKKTFILNFFNDLVTYDKTLQFSEYSGIIEIFYWFDDRWDNILRIDNFYTSVDLSYLKYKISIQVPMSITIEKIREVSAISANKSLPNKVDIFEFSGGTWIQYLHHGPFSQEFNALNTMQEFADEHGLIRSGLHQEIHLTNFEKGQDQTNLETILRTEVKQLNKMQMTSFNTENFIHFLNLSNIKLVPQFFSNHAVIKDISVGREFMGHVEVAQYIDKYFKKYHTKTELLKIKQINQHTFTIYVDFTGDFGKEKGYMTISLGADNLIEKIEADLN